MKQIVWMLTKPAMASFNKQEFGQGVARTLQERPGRAKRLQEWQQATQKQAGAAAEPQEKPQVASELQETWVAA